MNAGGRGPAPSPFGRAPCLGEPSSSSIPARDAAAALLSKLDVVINLETRANVRDASSEGAFRGTCAPEADTDLVLRQALHVAVVRLAVGHVPQLLRRPVVQLRADLVVVATEREVVRREAAVVQAVDVGAEVEEAADQRGVLVIDGQVERRPPAARFLQQTHTVRFWFQAGGVH